MALKPPKGCRMFGCVGRVEMSLQLAGSSCMLRTHLAATQIFCMCLPRFLRRTHATAAVYVAARSRPLAARAFHASAAKRAIDMAKVDTTARLAELRKLMKERNVDVYSANTNVYECIVFLCS
jgi:hypothetical protein